MQFSSKTLKNFSYDLLHDLEVDMLHKLENGVKDEWPKWFTLIEENIIKKAEDTALRNKRSSDMSDFNNFRKNLQFSDSIQIIIGLSIKGNNYFKKCFTSPSDRNLIQKALGSINRFRNLVFHPGGSNIFITDVKEYLKESKIICNILDFPYLLIKFKKIESNIEDSIFNSEFYIKDSIEQVYNNLPKADYEDWHGLVGRNTIKQELINDFNTGHNRVIAITGGGGIGKSALALDICNEFLKPTSYLFKHIIWITSKNNYLDYSGISNLKPDYFYNNNYKDFLNQFISGFYQKIYATDLDKVTEEELENVLLEIFDAYNRILCVVDNLENIDDPKILAFIKNKIIPPNYVLITSRNGLGEINKTYKLEPLDNQSALQLFQNLSDYYNIDYKNIDYKKIDTLLRKTNNYPLVIKWCLSLVANRKMELETAFSELNKPQNALLEFIFQKLYKQLSPESKKILRALALYKELPDRNIISYIAEIDTEEELTDSIFELERHSLINQERVDSQNGIIETLKLLGLAQTFINNITDFDKALKDKYEKKIIEIEQELDKISDQENVHFRAAQKLAQSKMLEAYQLSYGKYLNKRHASFLIKEAERLAPRLYIIPFYKALIELSKLNYDYTVVKQLFSEALYLNSEAPKVLFEYAKFNKKHKRESYKEYAPIFYKAFKLENNMTYGIQAGIAYCDAQEFDTSHEIIIKLKEIDLLFPKEISNKLWTTKVIINIAEQNLFADFEKAFNLLNSIENDVYSISQEKSKEFRLINAKYCSILSLVFAINKNPIKSREILLGSKEIVETYKSTYRESYEIRELICFNLIVEYLLSNDTNDKNKKIQKLDTEIKSNHQKELFIKFNPIKRKILSKI